MALTSYLTLEGTSQGAFKGDCDQKDREDTIMVYATKHDIEIPKDTHTGLPTGQRIHHPFTITKKIDNATPLIMQAVASGEKFKKWALEKYRIDKNGKEVLYYRVTLEDSIIVTRETFTPETFIDSNKPYHDMERVSFTYGKITEEFLDGGTVTGEDDWKTPSA